MQGIDIILLAIPTSVSVLVASILGLVSWFKESSQKNLYTFAGFVYLVALVLFALPSVIICLGAAGIVILG